VEARLIAGPFPAAEGEQSVVVVDIVAVRVGESKKKRILGEMN
jgi:hypothetical protein